MNLERPNQGADMLFLIIIDGVKFLNTPNFITRFTFRSVLRTVS